MAIRIDGPGHFINYDGRPVEIAGRTTPDIAWWSTQADWYDDEGRFMHGDGSGGHYVLDNHYKNIERKV